MDFLNFKYKSDWWIVGLEDKFRQVRLGGRLKALDNGEAKQQS